MSDSQVAVGSLGGTITMTGANGVVPALTADDLLAAVPGVPPSISVRTETLSSKPGASLTFADAARALTWAREQVTAGADGVVLVQGTDTLEETAYLLDLHWDRPEPLVLTGAMRSPQQAGADGPANVLASLITAAAAASRDRGALVVLNDEVHAASWVRKSDTTSLGAFTSVLGPLGRIVERSAVYGNPPWRVGPLTGQLPVDPPRVALLETFLGDDGELLGLVSAAGFDGVVLSAFGAGHVSGELAAMVSKVVTRMPVVFASRTGAGPVLSSTYGFVGSERDLLDRGAIAAGWLDARKARILLTCLAGGDVDVRSEFDRRSRPETRL